MSRVWIPCLLLVCGACGAPPPPPSAPSHLLDLPAPSFEQRALDGTPLSPQRLRGAPVLIEFFAEHCLPCQQSLRIAEELYRSSGVRVVGVTEDEDPDRAHALAERLGLTFPIVHDPQRLLAGRFRVQEVPAAFVLDSRGVVRWHGDRLHSLSGLREVLATVR